MLKVKRTTPILHEVGLGNLFYIVWFQTAGEWITKGRVEWQAK